ncbi:MAG TPA: proton-conducting transporter membrane subunit [Gaiellaceae bacterium]|nr:proton-conducting transporter membrane subunit [Gaiellaceae bacterium]
MSWIPPLLVAIPLLSAAVTAGLDHVTPEPVQDALVVAASVATTAFAFVLLWHAENHEVVHWFGGWQPHRGIALGIDFAVGPLAAGMCAVIGLVVTLALLYSLTFLREAARLFDALMLVALGAMCGFAMSGDLFNLFVWLELMAVAAYALTGFQVERLGPVQGAVNFAITNSLGGYLFAVGIALLYARTGALNLAQIGRTLSHGPAGGLVIVAMTLLLCGFLVKGAVVPFHLWAADAYAVAPAPVCAVLGGVMTDIGLIGVARLYWTVFAVPFGHGHAVGDVLLWLGIVTAVLAGTMAFLQRHLKRMLAYSVVCHIGIMLAGVGLLDSSGLAGAELMFLAHALLTAGLFFVAGILHSDHGLIDELHLRGLGRGSWAPAMAWFAGTIGLVGTPYVGIYLGHGFIDDGATELGRSWVLPLLWLGSALAGAALLRAGARIFLGWGDAEDELLGKAIEEDPLERDVLRPLLVGVALAAVLIGVAISVAPGLGQGARYAADRFRDTGGYAARVLHDRAMAPSTSLPVSVSHTSLESLLYGGGFTLVALGLALMGLFSSRLPRALFVAAERTLAPPIRVLHALHSGVVGDYVTWVVVGTAVTGGVWALLLHG